MLYVEENHSKDHILKSVLQWVGAALFIRLMYKLLSQYLKSKEQFICIDFGLIFQLQQAEFELIFGNVFLLFVIQKIVYLV